MGFEVKTGFKKEDLETLSPKKKLESNSTRFLENFELGSKRSGPDTSRIRLCLDNFVSVFMKEVCSIESGFQPGPRTMEEDACFLDLLKLFLIVKGKGGYENVSNNGLWDVVAAESGLGSNIGSSVKLVYTRYLDSLGRWLGRLIGVKNSNNSSSELSGVESSEKLGNEEGTDCLESKHEPKEILRSEVQPKEGKCVLAQADHERFLELEPIESVTAESESSAVGKYNHSASVVGKKCDELDSNLVLNKLHVDGVKLTALARSDEHKCGGKDDPIDLDSDDSEEHKTCRKRKRESNYRMLNWVRGIAKRPCDSKAVPLSERSKWKSSGNEELHKQVLMAREALFWKRNTVSNTALSSSQKTLNEDPCLYDDNMGSNYSLRERKAQISSQAKTIFLSPASRNYSTASVGRVFSANSSKDDIITDLPVKKWIPIGPRFQAEVPAWTGEVSESNPKWLGTCVWNGECADGKTLTKEDSIHKGRQDSCGCRIPESVKCIRSHIAERRQRMKHELGRAFVQWGFDKMGEEVKLVWKDNEKRKVKDMMRKKTSSMDVGFWEETVECFPNRTKQELVSYYFNVFLLQRRAHQNQFSPDDIDSDDDELEGGKESTKACWLVCGLAA